MRLAPDLKWEYWRITKDMYSILPPKHIRMKCGVHFAHKLFGEELKSQVHKLNGITTNYPSYFFRKEEEVKEMVSWLNTKWKKVLEKEATN